MHAGIPDPARRVLGIETSCDETAAAVVGSDRRILAEAVFGQEETHRPFGGVVPENAARAHVERLDRVIQGVMEEAGLAFSDLDAVAATAGPGLIGGVMAGLTTAKAIAWAADRPLVAVNHLEAHALTARLTDAVAFPYLLLLVSGGHCQLLVVEGVGRYRRIGSTIDDAAGEAFDKAAKMLGLGFPGGPALERAARAGDPTRFAMPRPLKGQPHCNFSFSGLKTALRQRILALGQMATEARTQADLAAAFQAAVADCLVDRTRGAARRFRAEWGGVTLVVAGGVAANGAVRAALLDLADEEGLGLVVPPARLCTDNAVMVAWAGLERLALGDVDPLDVRARPRWPLDPQAEPLIGRGASVKV